MNKKPLLAAFLSVLFPGLGQVYSGEYSKALTYAIVDIGILVSLILAQSIFTKVIMGGIYLMMMYSSSQEAFKSVKTGVSTTGEETKGRIIFLLVTTGFCSLPLLWQNNRFSRKSKYLWSLFVTLAAICFFTVIHYIGPIIEVKLV